MSPRSQGPNGGRRCSRRASPWPAGSSWMRCCADWWRPGRALTGARYSALGVLDETGNQLSQFITSGIDDDQRRLIGALPRGRGILGVLIHDATPLRLADLGDDPRSVGFPPNHPPMHSFLGVPITAGGAVFGNLYLTERYEGEFTAEDEEIAILLAAHAGVAIQNARLYAQAHEHAEALRRALTDLSSVSEINEAILSGRPQRAGAGIDRRPRPREPRRSSDRHRHPEHRSQPVDLCGRRGGRPRAHTRLIGGGGLDDRNRAAGAARPDDRRPRRRRRARGADGRLRATHPQG